MLLEREYISSFTWLCARHTVTKSNYVGFHHAARWKMLLEKATLFWRRLNCCRMAKKHFVALLLLVDIPSSTLVVQN